MVLLGDVGHVEARFGSFRDSFDLSTRWVHGLRRMYHHMEIISGTLDGAPR
jgi:hypothetical protein